MNLVKNITKIYLSIILGLLLPVSSTWAMQETMCLTPVQTCINAITKTNTRLALFCLGTGSAVLALGWGVHKALQSLSSRPAVIPPAVIPPALGPVHPVYRIGDIITHAPECIPFLDRDRNMPLHQAVRNNDIPATRMLLAQGHSPYVRNLYKETPLSIARVHAPGILRTLGLPMQGLTPMQRLLETGVKEYEMNRGLFRTIVNETITPHVGGLVAEYICGPDSTSFDTCS